MAIRSIGTFTAGALLASALTFTGMQSWQAGAAPGDDDTTFVPVAPCRLVDTRTGPNNVGIRVAPLGPGETFPTQVTGSNGECVGIPNDATAVAFNVTTVNPTADSFLTLFPADLTTPPTASNLNWVAGQSPTPNKVDVKLAPDGKVKIYNHAGTVDVIADIVGYYTPSSLEALQAQIDTLTADVDQIKTNQPRMFRSGTTFDERSLTDEWTETTGVTITAPAAGRVYLHGQGTAIEDTAGEDVHCVIHTTDETPEPNSKFYSTWEAAGPPGGPDGEGDAGALSYSTVRDVEAGQTSFVLSCKNTVNGGKSNFWGPQIFAIYSPWLN